MPHKPCSGTETHYYSAKGLTCIHRILPLQKLRQTAHLPHSDKYLPR